MVDVIKHSTLKIFAVDYKPNVAINGMNDGTCLQSDVFGTVHCAKNKQYAFQ